MAIQGNFRMGGIDYSTPSLNNNRDYAPSFAQEPAVDVPSIFSVPSLPAVTNQMSSNRQPGFSVSNDMLQEDMMKDIVKSQLQDLQQNKDILQNIDAGDGSGRNLYQTEIQDIITKSPLHQEAYLEEYPVGGAINIGVPDAMEALAKLTIPGLGMLDNFNIDPRKSDPRFSVENDMFDPGMTTQEKDPSIYDSATITDSSDNNQNTSDQYTRTPPRNADVYGTYNTPDNYGTGLGYAQQIAGGSNVPGMIAPSKSYSAAYPTGFTQSDINSGSIQNPFESSSAIPTGQPSPYGVFADDPSYFGTGIGGVTIFDDKDPKAIPLRDIITGEIMGGAANQVQNLIDENSAPQSYRFDPITRKMVPAESPDMTGKINFGNGGFVSDQQQPKGYQGLNLSGIQRVLDNLS
jgi:hypothetical protein